MLAAFKKLFHYRRILYAVSVNEIRSKYSGTILGLVWCVLYPLLFLGCYALVYACILKVRVSNATTTEYVLMIFSGLIPFLGFSEALSAGVPSVVSNRGLIKNTLFPIELIPVKAVITSSSTMLVGLCILMPILWFRGVIFWSQLLVPVVLVLQFMFTCGLLWVFAALNVFFRDLGQMIAVIILLLMLLSPIGYTAAMIPKNLMVLMYPNPLYYLIMLYRDSIVEGVISLHLLVIFTIISTLMFSVGYFTFTRLKHIFADHV